MINICHNCLYHEKCIMYRYKNVEIKEMKKVHRKKNKDGDTVIYVEECTKFRKRNNKFYFVETAKKSS